MFPCMFLQYFSCAPEMFYIPSAFFLLPRLLVNLPQAIIKTDLGHFLVKQNICDLLISQEGEI